MAFQKIKNWYGKYERPVSSSFLILGFVIDILTIQAISLYWQNVWIAVNLMILGTCIILVHRLEKSEEDDLSAEVLTKEEALVKAAANPSKAHFWLVNIMQFFFGGTLSTFLVSYFRGSDIAASWPFLLILALAFWVNESFKRHYVRLVFQISLFFLAVFTFFIFSVPFITHRLGAGIFILSGAVSLLAIGLFLLLVRFADKNEFEKTRNWLLASIGSIFVLLNLFYFAHVIPPLPLSIKDAGVYHSLKRNGQGNYEVLGEQKTWKNYFKLYDDFHKAPNDKVYVYSAVFSPPEFKMPIFHEWEQQDPVTKDWVVKERISLSVVGGRDGGFRTYSFKTSFTPGRWRVNVLTESGQVIGRIRFNVVSMDSAVQLIQSIK